MVLTLPGMQPFRSEVWLGSLYVGSMEGTGVEVVEMMQRRRLEVLCVQEDQVERKQGEEFGSRKEAVAGRWGWKE